MTGAGMTCARPSTIRWNAAKWWRSRPSGPFDVQVIQNYLAWNDVEAARKRDVPLDAILDESAAVRQGMVEAASRLSAKQLEQRVPFAWGGEGTIAQTMGGLHEHEMLHVRHIQQWRDKGRVCR